MVYCNGMDRIIWRGDEPMKNRRNWKKTLCALALVFALALCLAASAAAEETLPIKEWHFECREGTGNGITSEAMAQGYVNQQLYPDRVSRAVRDMGARLTGNEARVYQKLKAIIPDLAAGKRASTELVLPVEEIIEKTVITAKDLGVSSLFSNGELIPEADTAVHDAVRIQIAPILNALVEDMPYELYWFDKTAGIFSSVDVTYSFNSTRMVLSGTVQIYMVVAQEFAKGDEKTVDTSWGQKAQAAAKKARDIVNANSGLNDLDKLKAYKNAICDLADYNRSAANGMPYGNPWQLVWVFDGDPGTKVVCEGYSKAFKYLCDLSSFRGNITVGTAAGWMIDASGSYKHMWNIVAMDDGFNYLADLTNCDAGYAGYPDRLFLKGYISGDAKNGYQYRTNNGYIRYVYNTNVTNLYYENELEMRGEDYKAATPTPEPTPIYEPTPTPAPSVRPGNVNGDADGIVDGRDLLRLARYLAGQDLQIDRKASDVNGDGQIDGRDLLRLARFLAGQDVELKAAP